MPKDFTIIYLTDKETAKSKAVKTLFPDLPNGKWKIEVHNAKQRSTQQNRYYWGVVVPMVKDGLNEKGTELTTEETHEFLKYKFNSKDLINEDSGEVLQVPLSTTRLMTTGFIEYVEKIQRFAVEWLDVVIPDPGEQLQIDYHVALAEYDQQFNSVIVENGK